MSTRSIIIVTGMTSEEPRVETTVRFYKHCDGYPSGTLPIIRLAIEVSKILTGQAKCQNIVQFFKTIAKLPLDQDFDKSCRKKAYYEAAPFLLSHLGNQVDLEWIYILNTNDNSLKIYGGGFKNISPQEFIQRGLANPEVYVNSLYPKYREVELEIIKQSVLDIEKTDFSVN